MKNKFTYVFLILAFVCVNAQAARPQKKGAADANNDTYVSEPAASYSNKKYGASDFSKAKSLYNDGKIERSELMLNQILLSNPDFTEALELKNKIIILKEKLYVFKRDTSEEYVIKSERSLRDGNFYEGLLYYKKAVDLMPEIYDAQRYNTIIGELNAQSLKYKGSDRKKFLLSVESFQEGNFKKAKNLIDDLAQDYDHMRDFKGMADFYLIEYTNKDRIKGYYNEALNDFKAGRYENARVQLYLAIALDSKNYDVVRLTEQVNLELQ